MNALVYYWVAGDVEMMLMMLMILRWLCSLVSARYVVVVSCCDIFCKCEDE